MKRFLLGTVLALGVAGAGAAQEVSLAQAGLQKRINALSVHTAEHGFELGLLSALRSIERTLQTRYEYGLGDRLISLPMLRLELGQRNPFAKKTTSDTLADMMRAVLKDLETARSQLGAAADTGAINPFTLTLQDIWFDVNANGLREPDEDVIEALAPILLGRRALREITESGAMAQPLMVRFDAADHAWLTAYTHMLSGFASLFLAFDPAPVLQDLEDKRAAVANAPIIPNTFDPAALGAEIDSLEEERSRLEAQLKPIRAREKTLKQEYRTLRDANPRDADAVALMNTKLNRIRAEEIRPLRTQIRNIVAEISAAREKMHGGGPNQLAGFRNDVDAVYVLLATLRQQPDAAHIAATRDHWLEVIAQNKVFWAALAQETDNENEWIPNPQQTSVLPLEVSADLARSWQAILEDAEALLEGRLLLPHPLLPSGTGISLEAYVENPGPLDLLDWIHGIGAYQYAAKGPMITRQRWLAFQRLTRGNAGGFAIFFN